MYTGHDWQGLRQDLLETGCLKLPIVKFLGIQIISRKNHNIYPDYNHKDL